MVLSLGVVGGISIFYGPELRTIPGIDPGRPVEISGIVSGIPVKTDYGWQIDVKPSNVSQDGRELDYSRIIPLGFNSEATVECPPEIFRGSRVDFRGTFRRPSYNLIPGVRDRRLLAEAAGTPFSIHLKSSRQIMAGIPENGVLPSLCRYLQGFISFLDDPYPPRKDTLIRALLLGQKKTLPDNLYEKMNRLGITHFFVISGFHVGILAASLYLLLGRLKRNVAALSAAALIWMYIWIIGFPVPAVRAGIISSLGLFLMENGLQRKILNLLGAAALIIVGINPGAPFLPGFQLTFLAIAGIVLLAAPLNDVLDIPGKALSAFRRNDVSPDKSRNGSPARRVRTLLEDYCRHFPVRLLNLMQRFLPCLVWPLKIAGCTACIQFFLSPLLIYHFNCLNLFSPISTVALFLPVITLIILGMALLSAWWTPVAPGILAVYSSIETVTVETISLLDKCFPAHYFPHPEPAMIIIFYLLLFACLALCQARGWVPALVFLTFCLLLHPGSRETSKQQFEITMLDVGQGESLHLRYPDGQSAFIDTGGTAYPGNGLYVGKGLIGRYLWEKRIGHLNFVLITHPEYDHYGGYSFISQNFQIDTSYSYNPPPERPTSFKRLSAGDRFVVGGVAHEVLWPPNALRGFDSLNDRSLVLLVTYGKFQIILTGDISAQVEEQLIKRVSIRNPMVLKVAHHGSKYSSSQRFLDFLNSKIAIISAGRRNPFGHPAEEAVERMRSCGIKVYATPDHGTIRIITDGRKMQVETSSDQSSPFGENAD